MDDKIFEIIQPLFGKKTCRVQVGMLKSLGIGFGEKEFHGDSKLYDEYYGEWEIGTFSCAWRILKKKEILAGSSDAVHEIEDLNKVVRKINFGIIKSIEQISDFDVKIKFDSEIEVHFFASISSDDEYFHIFCPNNNYIKLLKGGKWKIEKSDKA